MARIIVVEDSGFLREDLVEEVELWGHQVEGFADGLAGYEAVKAQKPDLVLTDVHVPGLSGPELMRHVRNLGDDFKQIPFVFLTGSDGVADALPPSAITGFFQKPIDYGKLKLAIDRVLASSVELV